MTTKLAWYAALWLLPLPIAAQTPYSITMDQEPHHHLALHNEYVKVFKVEVSPGDSIVLHRHDQDTIAIAIGEQVVTIGIPGKPDVHQKNADAQVRLQLSGYMHSTRVDGNTPYHTVAVELLRPQTNFHNLCAEILPGQPLTCPERPAEASSGYTSQPLLASDETRVLFVRVLPGQSMNLEDSAAFRDPPQVIVALDPASISSGPSKNPKKPLKPGDFVWIDGGSGYGRLYQNSSDKDARFLEIIFPRRLRRK